MGRTPAPFERSSFSRAGRPIARLVPYEGPGRPRTPGGWEGRVRIAEDFDRLPEDMLDAFEGRTG